MFQPPVRVAGGIFLVFFGVLCCEGAVQYDVGLPSDIFENVLTHGEIWRIIGRVLAHALYFGEQRRGSRRIHRVLARVRGIVVMMERWPSG